MSRQKVEEYPLNPPPLSELAEILIPALEKNYTTSSISVTNPPDLRNPPFHLTSPGLSGRECIADIGGQPNLFPSPRLDRKFALTTCARQMGMSPSRGMLLGAGAGPWWQVGLNCEMAVNFSWKGSFDSVTNGSYVAKIDKASRGPVVERVPSTDCALMMNLFGSAGLPGPVLEIKARGRKGGEKGFTDCIRKALRSHYGDERPVSLGGVFVIKRGKSRYHIMPDFPPKPPGQDYTFSTPKKLNDWLTYHEFSAGSDGVEEPIVCLSVFHSVDPGKKMGLRMEHTHCFTADGSQRGGHYHHDLEGDEVEYLAYFNTAKVVYRIDRPEVTLERDLHD